MKRKLLKMILFFIIMMPVIINAKEKVYIESAELLENNNVEELSQVTFNDLYLNTNLKFSKVGSYITYKIIINNTDSDDYELDNNSFKEDTEYIKYTYNCDSVNNIIKRKSKTTCQIKISYDNPVPLNEVFDNTSHKEEKTLKLNLSSDLVNPKTSDSYINIILVIMLFISAIIFIKTKKHGTMITIIIISIIFIPSIISALKTITINMNSKIEIINNSKLCSHEATNLREHIMCIIETDIVDLPYKALKLMKDSCSKKLNEFETVLNDLNNGTKTYDDIDYSSINKEELENAISELRNEYNKLLELESTLNSDNFDELIENAKDNYDSEYYMFYANELLKKVVNKFDWDTTFRNKPTSKTYKNYPEGIYVDNNRFVPIIREINDNNLRGLGFTKITTQDDIRDVTPENEIIKVSKNSDALTINIESKANINPTEDNELIRIDANMDLSLTKDNNEIIISEWSINPESISNTLVHRRYGLINDMVDIYINLRRNNIFMKKPIYSIPSYIETENFFENFMSVYYQIVNRLIGIRKSGIMIYENDKLGFREKEFIKYSGIDFSGGKILRSEDGEELEKEKSFYDYYGLESYICDNSSNCKEGHYTAVPKNIDFSRYTVIYKDKFYEGEDGFFKFIADYLGIDTSNSTDIKRTIYEKYSR